MMAAAAGWLESQTIRYDAGTPDSIEEHEVAI
jgi:hypothetical protein